MNKKCSFLLLELFIAISILTLLLSPLIQPLFFSLKAENSAVETIRLRRRADLCFADVKAGLYSGSINKTLLPKEKGEKHQLQESSFLRFKETQVLKLRQEKQGKEGKTGRLFVVEISFKSTKGRAKKSTFRYNVFL